MAVRTQTPTGPMAINRDHPLTQRLAFCMVANQPKPVDLVTGRELIKGSGVSYSGGAYHFDESANGIITIPDGDWNFDKRRNTLFAVYVIARFETPTANQYPALIARGDTSANEWMFRESTANIIQTTDLSLYADSGDINANATNVINVGEFKGYSFSIDGSGAETYVNGKSVASDSLGTINVSAVTKPITIGGADGIRSFRGQIKMVLGFGTWLKPEQHAALHADPWSILTTGPKLLPGDSNQAITSGAAIRDRWAGQGRRY